MSAAGRVEHGECPYHGEPTGYSWCSICRALLARDARNKKNFEREDHLPECTWGSAVGALSAYCICKRLEACEERYEAERRPIDVRATKLAVAHGYEQGWSAAREVVIGALAGNRVTDHDA